MISILRNFSGSPGGRKPTRQLTSFRPVITLTISGDISTSYSTSYHIIRVSACATLRVKKKGQITPLDSESECHPNIVKVKHLRRGSLYQSRHSRGRHSPGVSLFHHVEISCVILTRQLGLVRLPAGSPANQAEVRSRTLNSIYLDLELLFRLGFLELPCKEAFTTSRI